MINGLRLTGLFWTVVLLVGCGNARYGPGSMDTRTYYGAFNMIVSEVENLQFQVNVDTYKGQFNPVEDQLGSAIHAFKTNEDVQGTPLEAEAQKLADLEQKIVELWKSRRPVDEIRAAAKEMQDQVEHMKSMI